jgi:signal transduction histidine kinase
MATTQACAVIPLKSGHYSNRGEPAVIDPADRVKCLIVEQHEPTLEALEFSLRAPDREVFTATTAAEAMNLSREHDFAFVLIDVQVPTLDGYQLAEMMRGAERSSATPIVFMASTGPSDPPPVFRGFESAAVDVLLKPVNPWILSQKAKLFVELYRQKQELARALRAREDVLAIVSHDLRTPLSVVSNTASMLLNPKYQLTPQQVREQHERIRRNVELMNRMIGDLLDMANLRVGTLSIDPQPMVVNDVLRDTIAMHEAAAREKGLVLSYEAGNDVMRADADRARLTQLFQNLIGNAIKFCKTGDRITIASRTRGDAALIEISDTGPGIAAEDLPHIFDPYYSASKKHQKTGTGLGLYISKGIVDAHRGEIRCGSQPGVGTTFSITLPLTPAVRQSQAAN